MTPVVPLIARLWALVRYLQRSFFRNPVDGAVSIACVARALVVLMRLGEWAIFDSVWRAKDGAECAQRGSGACWAVIRARWRLIAFGLYPREEEWRAGIACVILLVACVLSCLPSFWRIKRLVPLCVLSLAVFVVLMHGGVFGLPWVPPVKWGGVSLTLFVFVSLTITGMPLAYLLALARHSGTPWTRRAAGVCIDVGRALPLITVLFSIWLLIALGLPSRMQIDTLYRALAGYTFFFACYEAENLRGGLQAVGRGQEEAAKALGMRFWQYQTMVILPQAFRISLPQTMNLLVGSFKDTSYIGVLGLFDVVGAANVAVGTGDWNGQYVEVFVAVACFYLVAGFSLSKYGAYLERRSPAAW